jgi:hypothetical protein
VISGAPVSIPRPARAASNGVQLTEQGIGGIGSALRREAQAVLFIAEPVLHQKSFVGPEQSHEFSCFKKENRIVTVCGSGLGSLLQRVWRQAGQLPLPQPLDQRRDKSGRGVHTPQKVVGSDVRLKQFGQRQLLQQASDDAVTVVGAYTQQGRRQSMKMGDRSAYLRLQIRAAVRDPTGAGGRLFRRRDDQQGPAPLGSEPFDGPVRLTGTSRPESQRHRRLQCMHSDGKSSLNRRVSGAL